ncbi:MAG: alpha-L-fucosidase [Acidobacteriota bacterium]|nr:alpha-L-fucosidase [Acidobacteriota bacterium]
MPLSRRSFLAQTSLLSAASTLLPRSLRAQTGAPSGAPDAYATPKPLRDGPFKPTWASIRDGHHTPSWFNPAKFGIFIHWGLYSIPARGNEWYIKHMYTSDVQWHTEHYGAPDKFGYKDFIPLFTVPRYHPDEWAALFKAAGAKYVVPVAEHHDGFAMWNSDITPWSAGKMGPKRDLTGELAAAVRKQDLIFGLSTHRMEHHTFAYPNAGLANDQSDPRYAGFYGPPIPGDMNDAGASQPFQEDWLARVQELVDKYQPSLIYFDNGVNPRTYDPIKLRAAAYYFNAAAQWGKEVTFATKDVAFLAGSVQDFEKADRMPKWIYPPAWQVDDSIGSTWGYTESPKPMSVRSAASVISELIEISSQGGNLMLNVSPMGDGSIPEIQQKTLLAVGEWLNANGEGIYDSRPWRIMGEGPGVPAECPPDWRGGSTADQTNAIKADPGTPRTRTQMTEANFRFTTGHRNLYAFGYRYPASAHAAIKSLSTSQAKVERVTLLAPTPQPLKFQQTIDALNISLPPTAPIPNMPYALRIEGTQGLGHG